MRKLFLWLLLFTGACAHAQELYVFSEPASNMPAHSLSIKQTAKLLYNRWDKRPESRHTTECMFGINKNLMVHTAATFSDMYSSGQRWESARMYAKYRFFSNDALYRHFRMAAFAEGSYSRNRSSYDELSLDGDQSGWQAGLIATKLLHKLALSSTLGFTGIGKSSRWDTTLVRQPGRGFNYSVSAGYLVLPASYTDYKQVNLNVYVEMIGQHTTDIKRHFIDLAPAAQLIFNSQAKLSLGYRFQVDGNMKRMADKSWLLSFEWLFLNALK